MANYTPHNWQSGEIVYGTLLNHMEQGIADAVAAANAAKDATELRAAFNLLFTQTQAILRDIEARLSALESE